MAKHIHAYKSDQNLLLMAQSIAGLMDMANDLAIERGKEASHEIGKLVDVAGWMTDCLCIALDDAELPQGRGEQ